MDEILKLIPDVFKQHGLVGILVLLWALNEWAVPVYKKKKEEKEKEARKSSGEWVYWKDMNGKITEMGIKLEEYLGKSVEKDIKLVKIETKQEFLEQSVKDLKEGQHDVFRLVGEIKTFLISQKL